MFGLLVNFSTKVTALTPSDYGVFQPIEKKKTFFEKVLDILKSPFVMLVVPIIGLIVYWKKSRNSQNIKIYVTVGVIIIIGLIFYFEFFSY